MNCPSRGRERRVGDRRGRALRSAARAGSSSGGGGEVEGGGGELEAGDGEVDYHLGRRL